MRVLIDPNALAARGLTVADLETALETVALDAPAGSLSGGDQSLLVRADASVDERRGHRGDPDQQDRPASATWPT